MSADLNDQFVTRCRQCGTVMPVSEAVAHRRANPFLQRDICSGCASWMNKAQTYAVVAIIAGASISVLFVLSFVAYSLYMTALKN